MKKLKPILPTTEWKPVIGFEKVDNEGRAKLIEQALCLVWDSLHSHLPHTHSNRDKKDVKFEIRCVQEYSTLIHIISRLY